ncbi:hypothetical protein F5Y16DRAFT_373306 [Xylariaceae sp. FL0255]|nr:hypothetical protein F5Y16DRAFT_373306 [Xylariaceae sp. FL0255]
MAAFSTSFMSFIIHKARQIKASIIGAGKWCWNATTIGTKETFVFHSRAWSAMGDPIVAILNEPDTSQKDLLTLRWREQMSSQLNVILITSALTSSLVASSFSWPEFDQSPPSKVLAFVKATWYGSLLFSVFSIASAAQLSIALSRIATYRTDLAFTRNMLTTAGSLNNKLSYPKLYLWQIPAMLLNGSIYLYVLGITIFVYNSCRDLAYLNLRIEATGCLVIFSLALVWVLVNYALSSAGLYHWMGQACAMRY